MLPANRATVGELWEKLNETDMSADGKYNKTPLLNGGRSMPKNDGRRVAS
jgi:hypothetical protein